jgi:hypothetical protein
MASPSEHERLAELRAALRELEASAAQFLARREAERGYDPRRMSGVRAVSVLEARSGVRDARAVGGDAPFAGGDASLTIISANLVNARGRPAKLVLRLLRPSLDAVSAWWRWSKEKLEALSAQRRRDRESPNSTSRWRH